MATKSGSRRLTVAVGLSLGLAATMAQAAPPRQPGWSDRVLSATRLWLGELMGGSVPATRDKSAEVAEVAGDATTGIFKLKQHVDNPAQAPMKDDGE